MKQRLCAVIIVLGMLHLVGLMLPLFDGAASPVFAAEPCDRAPRALPNNTTKNLDDTAKQWGMYCMGSLVPRLQTTTNLSLDGKALRCALLDGGEPYSNLHCYRLLLSEPAARAFTLTLSFWYSPTTTFNNQGGDSIVQALEFAMSKTRRGVRREFAMQLANVLGEPGDPQWRYWDGSTQEWLSTGVTDTLAAQTWHTFQLKGDLRDGKVHYVSFSVDGVCHALGQTVSPEIRRGEPDRLSAAVQLDGNATGAPYELVIDRVRFVRSTNLFSGAACP